MVDLFDLFHHLRDPGIFCVIAGDLRKPNFSSISGVKLSEGYL